MRRIIKYVKIISRDSKHKRMKWLPTLWNHTMPLMDTVPITDILGLKKLETNLEFFFWKNSESSWFYLVV